MRIMDTNMCTEAATTVTASSSNPNFPVSNLKHPFRSKRWRSTSTTANVVFDFQTTEPMDSVVILWPKEDGIKLTASSVVKIQANATNVWTSPAVDQVLTINNDYSVASHYFTTDQNYRYWRLLVTDPTNPWGYIEIGMIWIGKSLSVENAENGFTYSLIDGSKEIDNDFGHVYTDEYPQIATLQFSYSYLDYASVQILENAFRRNGNRKPVLVVLDPEEAVFNKDHLMVYGKMSSRFSLKHVTYNLLNIPDLMIKELS